MDKIIPRAPRGISPLDVQAPESVDVNLEAFDAVWNHVKRHTSRFWNIKKKQQRRDKSKLETSKYTPEQRRAAYMLLRERRGHGSEPSDEIFLASFQRPHMKKQQERNADSNPRKPLSREPSFLELLKDDADAAIAAFQEAPSPRYEARKSRLTFVQSAAAASDSAALPDPNTTLLPSEVTEQKAQVEMPRNETRPTIQQHAPAPTSILRGSPREQNMAQIRMAVAKSCGGKKAAKGGRVPENIVLRSPHHSSDAFSNLADVRLVGLLHEHHAWQPDMAHELGEVKMAQPAHDTQEALVNAGSILDPPLSSFLKEAPKEPVVEHIPRHFKSDLLWLHPPRSVPASKVVVSDRQEFDQKIVYEVPPVEYADEATAALIARQRRRQGMPDKGTADKGNSSASKPQWPPKKGIAGRVSTWRPGQIRKAPSKPEEKAQEPTVCNQPDIPTFEWNKSRGLPTSSINSRMPRLTPRQEYQLRMRKMQMQEGASRPSTVSPATPKSPQAALKASPEADNRTSYMEHGGFLTSFNPASTINELEELFGKEKVPGGSASVPDHAPGNPNADEKADQILGATLSGPGGQGVSADVLIAQALFGDASSTPFADTDKPPQTPSSEPSTAPSRAGAASVVSSAPMHGSTGDFTMSGPMNGHSEHPTVPESANEFIVSDDQVLSNDAVPEIPGSADAGPEATNTAS